MPREQSGAISSKHTLTSGRCINSRNITPASSGDGDMGTGTSGRVCGDWDLGTRDEGLEEIKYGTRERVGRGRGDVKNRDAGDAGCE